MDSKCKNRDSFPPIIFYIARLTLFDIMIHFFLFLWLLSLNALDVWLIYCFKWSLKIPLITRRDVPPIPWIVSSGHFLSFSFLLLSRLWYLSLPPLVLLWFTTEGWPRAKFRIQLLASPFVSNVSLRVSSGLPNCFLDWVNGIFQSWKAAFMKMKVQMSEALSFSPLYVIFSTSKKSTNLMVAEHWGHCKASQSFWSRPKWFCKWASIMRNFDSISTTIPWLTTWLSPEPNLRHPSSKF